MFGHLAVSNFDLGGYELAKMLVDVPLHGVASIDPQQISPNTLFQGRPTWECR